jgi:hypothetical protein
MLKAFDKLKKGVMIKLYTKTHAEAALHQMDITQQARDAQSKLGKKQIAHARGGPIYVEDARATLRSKEELEIEKDNRALVRMWNAELREAVAERKRS